VRAASVEGDRHGQLVWRTNGLRPVRASSVEETGSPRQVRQRRPASTRRQCAGTCGWWGPRDAGLQAAAGGVVHAVVAGGVVHVAPTCAGMHVVLACGQQRVAASTQRRAVACGRWRAGVLGGR
jgi:hypothetical protein